MPRDQLWMEQSRALLAEARLINDRAEQLHEWMRDEHVDPRDPRWIALLRVLAATRPFVKVCDKIDWEKR